MELVREYEILWCEVPVYVQYINFVTPVQSPIFTLHDTTRVVFPFITLCIFSEAYLHLNEKLSSLYIRNYCQKELVYAYKQMK